MHAMRDKAPYVAFERIFEPSCGIGLNWLTYEVPGIQQVGENDESVRVLVLLNRGNIAEAMCFLPDETMVPLVARERDYANGLSLEEHLENVRKHGPLLFLMEHHKARRDDSDGGEGGEDAA